MHKVNQQWRARIEQYLREGRPVSGGLPVTQPTAQEIIAGPAQMWLAPVGTALPTEISGGTASWPPTWSDPWVSPGYTDKGVDLIVTPTIKPYTPDESRSPVYDIPTAEKAEMSALLAQGTLDNLIKAISAATLSAFSGKKRTLAFGNLPLTYWAVAFQGPSPADPDGSGTNVGLGVVAVIYKAIAASPITFAASRVNHRAYNVKWEARQIAGQDLFDIFEVIA